MSEESITIIKIPLASITPHPRQAELFGGLDIEEQLDELVEDIRTRGLQHPVEITPEFVTIAGHRRIEAVRRLGWTEIPAFLRHDLAAQGEAAIEQHLILDNFQRRNLSKLERAHCAKRLQELLEGGKIEDISDLDRRWEVEGSIRDRVGRLIGLSGRQADRLMNVLLTPPEVQQAYEEGDLSLAQVTKVVMVGPDVQEKVAADIRRGVEPKVAVDRHIRIGRPLKTMTPAKKACDNLLKSLRTAAEEVGGQLDQVTDASVPRDEFIRQLESAIQLLGLLKDRVQKVGEQRAAAMAGKVEEMSRMLLNAPPGVAL